jgi:hypothetical protein
MTPAVQTLAAINARLVAAQESSFRAHLGASVIGQKCARKLYYMFHWVKEVKHEAQLLRLFERGQLEEKRFVTMLRSIGCEVWEVDDKGKQRRISDCGGHFGGSLDGVARGLPDLPKDTVFLTEFKTHGAKSFAKLKEMGLIGAKWEHFVQMQIYMFKMDLPFGLYCAVCKDTDELFLEIVQLDKQEALKNLTKANKIIFATKPLERISESPAWYECKYCEFDHICHRGGKVDKNCRTCKFAEAAEDGSWLCHWHNKSLNEKDQRAGCSNYFVHANFDGRQA